MVLLTAALAGRSQLLITLELPDPCASVTSVQSPKVLQPVFTAFPNPTKGLLNLVSSGLDSFLPKTVEVYNLAGVLLFSFSWDGFSETTIDFTGMPPGIYFLSVSGTDWKARQRIIKL